MQRSFLVFATAFVALMDGALFYAARFPVEVTAPAPEAEAEAPSVEFVPVYPSFKMVDMDGAERDFSEWQGTHRLLNFWATWCAPCRREIPLLKEFQAEHGDEGFQIIGVAVDFPEQVTAYAENAQFNYPILVGQEDAMAIAATSGIEFIGMPFTMIVYSDGELIGTHIGEIRDSHLEHIHRVLTMLDNQEIDKDSARKALNFL